MKKLHTVALLAVILGLFPAFIDVCRGQATSYGQGPGDAAGAQSYARHCAICHGEQREGILPDSRLFLT
jgi:mono/diheme cytochrome c family protein